MHYREAIEYFHLLFCQRIGAKIDKKLLFLKGGCNLRFFFQSIRYSEDIDFDVHTISPATLRKHVEKVLEDSSFRSLLRHQGIDILEWSAPKQTEVTQRWKISLRVNSQSTPVPTKIEFSRRLKIFSGGVMAQVQPTLISHYRLQPILLQHYDLSRAIEQKIAALIGRTETQARDVIDLKLLIGQDPSLPAPLLSTDDKNKAMETLASISYDDFKSQVWPYLLPEFQEHYEGKTEWDSLHEEVLTYLQSIKENP